MIIDTFKGEYGFLSNFYPAPVEFEGILYPTVEHAYQAAKTLDGVTRRAIANLSTPGRAKKMGRELTLRPNWEQIKLAVMLDLLRQKFWGSKRLYDALLATGDSILVEGNTWGDDFWGDDFRTPRGNNWLGHLLMVVRSELHLYQW